jgi:hypothetical protein
MRVCWVLLSLERTHSRHIVPIKYFIRFEKYTSKWCKKLSGWQRSITCQISSNYGLIWKAWVVMFVFIFLGRFCRCSVLESAAYIDSISDIRDDCSLPELWNEGMLGDVSRNSSSFLLHNQLFSVWHVVPVLSAFPPLTLFTDSCHFFYMPLPEQLDNVWSVSTFISVSFSAFSSVLVPFHTYINFFLFMKLSDADWTASKQGSRKCRCSTIGIRIVLHLCNFLRLSVTRLSLKWRSGCRRGDSFSRKYVWFLCASAWTREESCFPRYQHNSLASESE